MTRLEICVDDADGLDTAIANGADRIELCSVLELGGLTPLPGLMALAAQAGVPVRAMVRPRPGDFVFSPREVETMLGDIAAARAAGLEGVVLGASLPDGRLDVATLRVLAEAAAGMGRTLHRAIDLVPDLGDAVEEAVALGFDTVLTSGRAHGAVAGLSDIAELHRLAAGRIAIMAGSGVSAGNAGEILGRVPLGWLHGGCGEPAVPASAPAARLGFESPGRKRTSGAKVAALKAAIGLGATGGAG